MTVERHPDFNGPNIDWDGPARRRRQEKELDHARRLIKAEEEIRGSGVPAAQGSHHKESPGLLERIRATATKLERL